MIAYRHPSMRRTPGMKTVVVRIVNTIRQEQQRIFNITPSGGHYPAGRYAPTRPANKSAVCVVLFPRPKEKEVGTPFNPSEIEYSHQCQKGY